MLKNHLRWSVLAGLLVLFARFALAESFPIQIGDEVSPNVPGAGAGIIEASTATDTYTFAGTAGQLIFAEKVFASAEFKGWLQWELRAPSGALLFSAYFNGQNEGRRVLPETGSYTVRVWVGSNNASYVGNYGFRIRAIPPDQLFTLHAGDLVTTNAPAEGAGAIEVLGAQDLYDLEGTAGQILWFEELAVSARFGGWLRWEFKSPTGQTLFSSYFELAHEGRKVLPETGTYRLRVYSGDNTTNQVGQYSFRVRAVPPDQAFAIAVGQTITNGAPAAGAGNLEVAGAQDVYAFTGVAGQKVFFEQLGAAATLGGWLYWDTKTPSGQTLFNSGFTSGGTIGRRTLPETGTYTITCRVASNDPSLVGTYGFRLTSADDGQFPILIGQVVSNGVPAAGAGVIETAGAQDVYVFPGLAGLRVWFEQLQVASTFNHWLKWELRTPSSNVLRSDFFLAGQREEIVLPEDGSYQVRIFVGTSGAQLVGDYAFRTWCDVAARADRFAVAPGGTLVLTPSLLLCDDWWQTGDKVQVELPEGTSAQGGSVAMLSDAVVYTPAPGFVGQDSFPYRLRGQLGGADTNLVSVEVVAGADERPVVIQQVRSGPAAVGVCLFGQTNMAIAIEQSADLAAWEPAGEVACDTQGLAHFQYRTDEADKRFYRFKRKE
jgi:hypothetical protein